MFKKLSCSNQVVLLLGVSYPHGIVVVPSRFRGLDVAKTTKCKSGQPVVAASLGYREENPQA